MAQDIGRQIVLALKEYTTEVMEEIEKSATEIAKEAVKELKQTSPKDTGEYARGWTHTKDGKNIVIYNRRKPGLTHLLEKGHLMRNGRTSPKYPHIEPVEQKAIKDYEKAVDHAVETGGVSR